MGLIVVYQVYPNYRQVNLDRKKIIRPDVTYSETASTAQIEEAGAPLMEDDTWICRVGLFFFRPSHCCIIIWGNYDISSPDVKHPLDTLI